MFGENIGSLVDISLTLIRLRIYWPTLTIIRCQWSCNRLQYVKLCASSLFFRTYLDVWLLQKKWIDWVRQWFWVESSVLHAAACTAGRSWDFMKHTRVVMLSLCFWRPMCCAAGSLSMTRLWYMAEILIGLPRLLLSTSLSWFGAKSDCL